MNQFELDTRPGAVHIDKGDDELYHPALAHQAQEIINRQTLRGRIARWVPASELPDEVALTMGLRNPQIQA